MGDAATPAGASEGRAERRATQAAAFDAIGGRYDEAFPHKDGQLVAGDWLAARLPAGARVLDVGCGTGVPTARALTHAGCAVTGIDISAGMLDLARANVPDAEFVQGDVLDIEATTFGRYDAVVAFFTLLMLPCGDIPVALQNLHAVLRPGGWLALAMVEADLDDVPIPFVGHTIRVSGYPRERLRAVVEAGGFAVQELSERRYEPASPDVPPEVQLFLTCRRG